MRKKAGTGLSLAVFNTLSLGPAVVFWASVALYTGLGSDYFFEVVLTSVAGNWWGNLLVILVVIGLPGLAVAVNGMAYMLYHRPGQRVMAVVGGLLVILGLYIAAIRA